MPGLSHDDVPCPLVSTEEYAVCDLGRNVGQPCRLHPEQRFEHPAHQIVLQELVLAIQHAQEAGADRGRHCRVCSRLVAAPAVEALQALRGVNLISAVTFLVEVGDLRRFETPRQLMGYLGLVPGERSTGETVRKEGITKAGEQPGARTLVESAWTYRYPPRIGKVKLDHLQRSRRRSATSPGKRRADCARGSGRSRREARSRRWP